MIVLKQVIHFPSTNSVEASWVDTLSESILVADPDFIPPMVEDGKGTQRLDLTAEAPLIEKIVEREVVVKCHSYADVQMGMLLEDLGADGPAYAELIALVESGIKPAPEAPPEPPIRVSPWQMRKALNRLGLRDEVENAVARSSDRVLKDGWEYATELVEDDSWVVSMCEVLGKDADARHALFLLAASL